MLHLVPPPQEEFPVMTALIMLGVAVFVMFLIKLSSRYIQRKKQKVAFDTQLSERLGQAEQVADKVQ